MYQFDEQLVKGEKYENIIDQWIASGGVKVKPVSKALQLIGIDRLWIKDEKIYTVEYKADLKAAETGNIFVEIVSNDTTGKSGWAYTTGAQRLLVFVPGDRTVYILFSHLMKRCIEKWRSQFPIGSAANPSYNSKGILVPRQVFKEDCEAQEFVL